MSEDNKKDPKKSEEDYYFGGVSVEILEYGNIEMEEELYALACGN